MLAPPLTDKESLQTREDALKFAMALYRSGKSPSRDGASPANNAGNQRCNCQCMQWETEMTSLVLLIEDVTREKHSKHKD